MDVFHIHLIKRIGQEPTVDVLIWNTAVKL